MKLQENEWAKCECCGQRTEQTQEEKYGCDWCRQELVHRYPLEVTLFGAGDDDGADHLHLCSWKCVIAILPTLKPSRFLTLPYVSFDDSYGEGQRPEDLFKLLGR